MFAAATMEKDWIGAVLAERGGALLGDPAVVRAYPWSRVTRFPTTSGDVYFKQIALPYSVEPQLVTTLSGWVPGKVPTVLAIDAERRWLLMADAGAPLRERLKADFAIAPLASALTLIAEVQRETAGQVEALLSLGLADWRLATLPGRYRALVDAADLQADERIALQALTPRLEALCAALAAHGLPDALEHCDFQDNNVLVRGGHQTAADWGDAVISHPFLSLASCLDSAGWNHGLVDADAGPLIAAYLDVWSAFGTRDRLSEAARLARRLRPILVALNFARVIGAAVGADRYLDVTERLRAFLQAERSLIR
jgi:hypothetical protein